MTIYLFKLKDIVMKTSIKDTLKADSSICFNIDQEKIFLHHFLGN